VIPAATIDDDELRIGKSLAKILQESRQTFRLVEDRQYKA
jgi:hypothetical protein